jgi:hypothetical protein
MAQKREVKAYHTNYKSSLKHIGCARCWWLTPVILATGEAEIWED